jgi:signal transduction histidine kinase
MIDTGASSPRVLLVHRQGATARGAVEVLRGEGIDVSSAENVFQAVSLFAERPADLVHLSLAEFEERDLEVLRVLRDIRPSVYVLLSFPMTLRDLAVKALARGADAYVVEPFYLGEYLDLVRRGIARARIGAPAPAPESTDLERLAGAVAHAVNNPLQIVELLLSQEAGKLERGELRQEARRIRDVVVELLAFSRRRERPQTALDLNGLLRELVPEGTETEVTLDLSPGLPELHADEEGLRLLLTALLSLPGIRNGHGPLSVATGSGAPGQLSLRFHAPDLILSESEVRSFFRPFESPLPDAVGLSAATARAVVDAHSGEIEVTSREGEGTRVVVNIPF